MTLDEVLQEGWTIIAKDTFYFVCKKEINATKWIELGYDLEKSMLQIMKTYPSSPGGAMRETIYNGKCSDLETFRYLCKLLDI